MTTKTTGSGNLLVLFEEKDALYVRINRWFDSRSTCYTHLDTLARNVEFLPEGNTYYAKFTYYKSVVEIHHVQKGGRTLKTRVKLVITDKNQRGSREVRKPAWYDELFALTDRFDRSLVSSGA